MFGVLRWKKFILQEKERLISIVKQQGEGIDGHG
jgi:hypothetical protein